LLIVETKTEPKKSKPKKNDGEEAENGDKMDVEEEAEKKKPRKQSNAAKKKKADDDEEEEKVQIICFVNPLRKCRV
jgi:DNA-directed RNA polymerase delta subunit